ncbi:ATP-binding protein [Nocardia neocaledoniensis]|uniref:ATP-binding protein n=1 Tax=Nocardia neocaledoniensis TaxID=236511 RepID=UPI002453A221|nr:ATP-binding protein [Nocardia neocaledoniensis]
MTADWQFDVPTTGRKYLPPDARYMEALTSQGYGFEAAVADLVDNSIDAGAKDVVIHFLRDGDDLLSLLIIDDGIGMTEAELEVAMTVGGRRDYADNALGMFGTGLKSASLSQASAVTVVSRTKKTRPAGLQWVMERARDGFQCDIVEPAYAQALIDRYHKCPIEWHGTVVRWDGVKDFPRRVGSAQTGRYLDRMINRLGAHLGLQLHRFLARDDFNITIAVEDVRSGTIYTNLGVVGLNPFGYPVTGHPDYPRTFVADLDSIGKVQLTAHVWTPRSSVSEYKAVGSVLDRQGFYFYRNGRIVQAGGWNNYRQPEQHLSLARVDVDLPKSFGDVFRLTVKKEGVEVSPEFVAALELATDDGGRSFADYINDAQTVYREARQRSGATRKAVIPPGRGFAPAVKETIHDELPQIPGEASIGIEWRQLPDDVFFDIDRDTRTIALNKRFRSAVLGGRNGSLNDAPLVKALMFFLLHEVFGKEHNGSRIKDNLALWQSVLIAAARVERDQAGV